MLNDQGQEGSKDTDRRDAQIAYHYMVRAWTQQQIADKFGISRQRVQQILDEERSRIKPPDMMAMREKALRRQEDIIRRAYEVAEMLGAPVTAGKDGAVVIDPETGKVVRDMSAKLNALALALKTDAETRKLLGLDAASKTEVSGSVRFTIEGVDPEDLS